jgi:hypothetical protein
VAGSAFFALTAAAASTFFTATFFSGVFLTAGAASVWCVEATLTCFYKVDFKSDLFYFNFISN